MMTALGGDAAKDKAKADAIEKAKTERDPTDYEAPVIVNLDEYKGEMHHVGDGELDEVLQAAKRTSSSSAATLSGSTAGNSGEEKKQTSSYVAAPSSKRIESSQADKLEEQTGKHVFRASKTAKRVADAAVADLEVIADKVTDETGEKAGKDEKKKKKKKKKQKAAASLLSFEYED